MLGTFLRVNIAVFALALLLWMPVSVAAQSSASMLGRVEDATGAPLDAATITVTRLATR